MPESSFPLIPAALARTVAYEMAALALLRRDVPVPASLLSEVASLLSHQLSSIGFTPAGESRARLFDGIDRPALPQDIMHFLIADLLELLNQLGRDDLQTRSRITAASVEFVKAVIGEFLAEDARQEVENQRAIDDYYGA